MVFLALLAEGLRLRQQSFRTYRVEKNYAVTTGKWWGHQQCLRYLLVVDKHSKVQGLPGRIKSFSPFLSTQFRIVSSQIKKFLKYEVIIPCTEKHFWLMGVLGVISTTFFYRMVRQMYYFLFASVITTIFF